MDKVLIRVATMVELPLLLEIERASGEIFRDIGMPEIADDAPMPVDVLAHHHVWVAVADEPVAFAVATVIDGCAHIEQVSVHPTHARLGIGRQLLDHVAHWAAAQGLEALTLTTFREVPWAPTTSASASACSPSCPPGSRPWSPRRPPAAWTPTPGSACAATSPLAKAAASPPRAGRRAATRR